MQALTHWFFGTLTVAMVIVFLHLIQFGDEPATYSALYLSSASSHMPELWYSPEGGLSRSTDFLFAPLIGLVFMLYMQLFFHHKERLVFMLFGIAAYVLLDQLGVNLFTLALALVVAACLVGRNPDEANFKIVFSLTVMTGWYTWAAEGEGVGIFPWLTYSLLLLIPCLVVWVSRKAAQRIDLAGTE